MAISSIAGTNYGAAAMRLPTTACPTCGGTAARQNTAQAYSGGYTGRSDAFTCATCGPQKATAPASRTPAGASSAYCPTCGGNHAKASSFPSTVGNTYNCPTCGKGPTVGSTATKAAANVNTIAWAR